MRKQIKVVFILLFILVVLINAFQVFFLFKNYEAAKSKQQDYSNSSLLGVLIKYYQIKINDISKKAPRHSTYIVTTINDTLIINKGGPKLVEFKVNNSDIIFDSIKTQLGKEFLQHVFTKNEFDKKLFDSLYSIYLESNYLNTDFIVDTIHSLGSTREPTKTGDRMYEKRNDAYPVKTNPLRMGVYSDVVVYAQLKYDYWFLFKMQIWEVLSILLTLIVTNGSLYFIYKIVKKQKKVSEIKNDFINNMTHELQTPLTIASAGMDAILNHHGVSDLETVRSSLDVSKKQLEHLNILLDKILQISVEETTEVLIKVERVDLKEIFDLIIHNHRLLNEKKLEFLYQVDGDSVFIYGDKIHLGNAFNNIIENAIKYSKESVRISINVEKQRDNVKISIKDNGIGIPTEYHPYIFEKFFRVPRGNLQNVKGFGLGLFYVKSIIDKHKGDIKLKSSESSGTEFIIYLPYK